MKNIILVLLFTISCVSAQVDIQGNYSSSFYSFKNPANDERRLNQYHSINFKINPENNSDLYFKGYIKAVNDGDPQEWHEKVHNAYFYWQLPDANTNVQIGRQFIYAGVVNGTLDAVAVSLKPADKLNVKLYGGVVAPYKRELKLTKWDDGNALGGYSSYKVNDLVKVSASYFQKQRNSELYWQQLGTTFSGNVSQLSYLLKYDHNLLSSTYQSIVANAFYSYKVWSFSAEVSSQKPKVYEDSFFSIFKLKEYKQMRLAVTRRFSDYEIGLQAINTLYEEDKNNQQFILTAGNYWGVAGVVYQHGFGGENVGLYANINFELIDNLRIYLNSSHYQYERESVQIDEEATSFSGGIKYNPLKPLGIDIMVQQSMNSYYDSDFRGLLKLAYSFNY